MGEPVDLEKLIEQAAMERENEMYTAGEAKDLYLESVKQLYLHLETSGDPQANTWCDQFKDLVEYGIDLAGQMSEYNRERDTQEMTDVEADADTLRSAGFGTDEDYGGGDERL